MIVYIITIAAFQTQYNINRITITGEFNSCEVKDDNYACFHKLCCAIICLRKEKPLAVLTFQLPLESLLDGGGAVVKLNPNPGTSCLDYEHL